MRSFLVDRLKDDHPVLFAPHAREYDEVFEADPRYRLTDAQVRIQSANNESELNHRIVDDGKRLVIHYKLTSGPQIDRWHGSLKADVVATVARTGS